MAELEASSSSPSDDQRAPSPPPDSLDHRCDAEPDRPPPTPTVVPPKEKRVASERQREALRRAREAKKVHAAIKQKVKKASAPAMRIRDEPVILDFDEPAPPPVREERPRHGGINLLVF